MKPNEPTSAARAESRPARADLTLSGTIAIALLALGGVNWGLIGLAGFDAFAWLFGAAAPVTRAIQLLLGALAVYCLIRLPRWSRAS